MCKTPIYCCMDQGKPHKCMKTCMGCGKTYFQTHTCQVLPLLPTIRYFTRVPNCKTRNTFQMVSLRVA
jgi:hypothetical protein